MSQTSSSSSASKLPSTTLPWWKHRMLWLVIAGPAIVVVASLITAYVAIVGQDPVLLKEDVPAEHARPGAADSLTPAVQARNHAATPAAPEKP